VPEEPEVPDDPEVPDEPEVPPPPYKVPVTIETTVSSPPPKVKEAPEKYVTSNVKNTLPGPDVTFVILYRTMLPLWSSICKVPVLILFKLLKNLKWEVPLSSVELIFT
jgi:hypothetical protein